MNDIVFNIYRTIRFIYSRSYRVLSNFITKIFLYINNVSVSSGFKSNGIPKLHIHHTGKFRIGKNFKINNTIRNNPIGRSEKCMFIVRENALLTIRNNVGMSGVTIVCQKEVVIEDNVKIGGNVCIYDTDFHALNAKNRNNSIHDRNNTNKKKVVIGKNAFIGAHFTILKGVNIGENSIIGACSVVSKNIPSNEMWAGNPAKCIKKIYDNK